MANGVTPHRPTLTFPSLVTLVIFELVDIRQGATRLSRCFQATVRPQRLRYSQVQPTASVSRFGRNREKFDLLFPNFSKALPCPHLRTSGHGYVHRTTWAFKRSSASQKTGSARKSRSSRNSRIAISRVTKTLENPKS